MLTCSCQVLGSKQISKANGPSSPLCKSAMMCLLLAKSRTSAKTMSKIKCSPGHSRVKIDMPRSLQRHSHCMGDGTLPMRCSTHIASASDDARAAHSYCMYECMHGWLMNLIELSMS